MSLARHPGPGSGCQGCDPAVPMPSMADRPFLCALCQRWMEIKFAELQGNGVTKPALEILADRRAALTEAPADA